MRRIEDIADELGALRAQMRALKAREDNLRARLLAQPAARVDGARFSVLIQEQRQSRFDKSLLPQAIQDDPKYTKVTMQRIVKAMPLEERHGPPPARREAPLDWDDANFQLIDDGDVQNKKYRCAIGSSAAGSQVSSSPSARTS